MSKRRNAVSVREFQAGYKPTVENCHHGIDSGFQVRYPEFDRPDFATEQEDEENFDYDEIDRDED